MVLFEESLSNEWRYFQRGLKNFNFWTKIAKKTLHLKSFQFISEMAPFPAVPNSFGQQMKIFYSKFLFVSVPNGKISLNRNTRPKITQNLENIISNQSDLVYHILNQSKIDKCYIELHQLYLFKFKL